MLDWEEDGDRIIVKRSGLYTFEDMHRELFPERLPKKRTLSELKEWIRQNIRERHARR